MAFDDDARRFVTAIPRPGKRPADHEIVRLLRRLAGAIRAIWLRVEIMLRPDSR